MEIRIISKFSVFIAVVSALLTTSFAQNTVCGTTDDVFINVGGSHLSGNYRCDAAGTWASSNVIPYQIPRAVMTTASGCKKQYERMVWAATGDIVYTIPVPAGSYNVILMFLEPIAGFHGGTNRIMTAKVGTTTLTAAGSANLNIQTLAGGLDKPYTISTTASPIDGNIVITIGRVERNPFLSGIAIQGLGGAVASSIVGNTGINTCAAPVSVTPSSTPSVPVGPAPVAGVKCPSAGGIFINAGGDSTSDDYRCDVPGLWTASTTKYTQPRPVISDDTCVSHLQMHRYAGTGNLEYNIPVPAGEFNVDLQFMENYPSNIAGMRKFTITIDGVAQTANGSPNFDIFSLAGGLDKPYVVTSIVNKASAGNINIVIGRVAGMDNPFISGIAITGTNADSVVGTSGVGSCTAVSGPPTVTPSISSSVQPGNPGETTPTDLCGETGDLFINAGGPNTAGGYRCDAAGGWAALNTNSYFKPTGLTSATGCVDQYLTAAWAGNGDIVYTIPVPAGSHTVNLMFLDPVATHVVGSRLFNIKVGATADFLAVSGSTDIDIVKLAGGAQKPYVVTTTVSTAGESLVITIARIPGKQNPMLSAIGIKGAAASVGNLGLTSCDTTVVSPPTVTPSTSPAISVVTPSANPGIALCPTAGNVFIDTGGNPTADGYRCDVEGEWRASTHKYKSQRPIITTETTCITQYSTQASLFGTADLVYNIPVPAGTFSVSLMFMENWAPHGAGDRLFTITVGGKAVNAPGGGLEFDIWTLAGGTDKPYIVTTTAVHGGGNLVINIGRTPKDNPMLSGIGIVGPGADDLISNTGLGSCTAPFDPLPNSLVTPTPTVSSPAAAPLGNFALLNPQGSLPTIRHESGLAYANGKVYLMGGRRGQNMYSYDPVANTWDDLGILPQGEMHHFQAVTVGTKIYIPGAWFGGFPNESTFADMLIYDTVAGQWSTVPGPPASRRRGAGAVGVYKGKIYFAAGSTGGHGSSTTLTPLFDMYDPANPAAGWTALPNIPNARDHTAGAVLGDYFCVGGGRLGNQVNNGLAFPVLPIDCYNFKTSTWETKASLPATVGRSGVGVASTCDGKMLIGGGESPGQATTRVDVFDPVSNEFLNPISMEESRHGFGMAAGPCPCGKVYVAAGSGNAGATPERNSIEALTTCGSSGTTPTPTPVVSIPVVSVTPAPTTGSNGAYARCPTSGNVFINAGGNPTTDGYRCDVVGLWRTGTDKYAPNRVMTFAETSCVDQYRTHAYASSGDLVYNIPLPQGSYDVSLMFSENYNLNTAGSRKFTIEVGGTALTANGNPQFDIFTLGGGIDKPYVVDTTVQHNGGNLLIILGRVPGMDNPFISGISISGAGAGDLVGNSGVGGCLVDQTPAPTVEPVGVNAQYCVTMAAQTHVNPRPIHWTPDNGTKALIYRATENDPFKTYPNNNNPVPDALEFTFTVPIRSHYAITMDSKTEEATDYNDCWIKFNSVTLRKIDSGETSLKGPFTNSLKAYQNTAQRTKAAFSIDNNGHSFETTQVLEPGTTYTITVEGRSGRFELFGLIMFPCQGDTCWQWTSHHGQYRSICNV